MDVRLAPKDEIMLEYRGLMPRMYYESGANESELGELVPIRVDVVHDKKTDHYVVVWQFIEGNLDDEWTLMWRDDDLRKTVRWFTDYITDLMIEYGTGRLNNEVVGWGDDIPYAVKDHRFKVKEGCTCSYCTPDPTDAFTRFDKTCN